MSFDPESLLSALRGGGLLSEAEVEWVCSMSAARLLQCPNVLLLQSPVTVCGDVHGQYHDLLNLFQAGGAPSSTQYLFLGDLVDRGSHGLEVLLTLLLHCLQRPGRFHVLRGNHESRRVSATYGFYDECMRKYGTATVWTLLTDLFDYLPIAALIDHSVFAVHGGLSPHLPHIAHMELVDRVREIPQDGGPLADLMWSDPADESEIAAMRAAAGQPQKRTGRQQQREQPQPAERGDDGDEADEEQQWVLSPRGGGYLFGPKATQRFLHRNGLGWMVRSHQLCLDGWRTDHGERVLTVWSAPNYCYRCGNAATVALVAATAAAAEDARTAYKLVAFHKADRQEEEAERAMVDYFL